MRLQENLIPEYLPPIDEHITAEAQEQIWKEWDLIPEAHQDILKDEMDIWRSPFGNSRTDKRFGIVYMADELDEGEFIHEAAHILEEHFQVYQDERFVKILRDSLRGGKYIADEETFEHPVSRVESPKLVSVYQGRAYIEYGIPLYSDGELNPNAFAEFFAEGYKTYVLNPDYLKRKNRALWNYVRGMIQ